jgi:hypothetical protein
MLATTRFFEGAVDDTLRCFPYLTGRNIEVVYVHVFLLTTGDSKTCARALLAAGAARKRL